jgi:hypothetical protein
MSGGVSSQDLISKEHSFQNLGMWDKIKELTIIVYIELRTNPILIVGIIGGTIVRLIGIIFSTYLIIWI